MSSAFVQPTLSTSTSRVYTDYTNPADLPPQENGWTRFVCLSDTHSHTFWDRDLIEKAGGSKMPRGDVLLHAGDLSSYGTPEQLKKTIDWLAELDGYGTKIIIAGNHDLCLEAESELYISGFGRERKKEAQDMFKTSRAIVKNRELEDKKLIYLEYDSVTIRVGQRDWVVYGSPASPMHYRGAFQYQTNEEAAEINARIPSSTHILLTHTPPYNVLDKTRKGKHAGCQSLQSRLDSGELDRCRLHVFGHIHEAAGVAIVSNAGKKGQRVAVNAAISHPKRAVVVDLKN